MLAPVDVVRTVVLVEGDSDRAAVEALARRRGIDLGATGAVVEVLGGATNVARALEQHGRRGRGRRVTGLCDAGEAWIVRRALERSGYGAGPTTADIERLGFFVCVADLEDELIRALGPAGVEAVLGAAGDLVSFRRFQRQPAQRGRPIDQQLRRFMGTRSGRKVRYGRLLTDALDLDRIPRPLGAVVDAATGGG
jgi:Overcoming lysogenization defect protein-like, TOPRIM domain